MGELYPLARPTHKKAAAWPILGRTMRREVVESLAAFAAIGLPQARRFSLGLNTYCLRFQRWDDRKLLEYCGQGRWVPQTA
jgi:hypothetical protein